MIRVGTGAGAPFAHPTTLNRHLCRVGKSRSDLPTRRIHSAAIGAGFSGRSASSVSYSGAIRD
jgi:hypothetical protein